MYHFKINEKNTIIDAVPQQHEWYIATDIQEIPTDLLDGMYKLLDGHIVDDVQAKLRRDQLPRDIEKLHNIKTRSKEMRLEYLTTENRLERQTAAWADTTLTQAMLDEIAIKWDVIEQEMSAQMSYMMQKYNMTAQEVMWLLLQ